MNTSCTSQDTCLETLDTLDFQTLETLDFKIIENYLEQVPNNSTMQNQNRKLDCKICHDFYGTPEMCFHPEIH